MNIQLPMYIYSYTYIICIFLTATSNGITPSPTPKPTTKKPTAKPTNEPTLTPTYNPTVSPSPASEQQVELGAWSDIYTFSQARSQQICGGDENALYFFGGMEWTVSGGSYSSEIHELLRINDDFSLTYFNNVYQYKGSLTFTMVDVSCSHPCSAIYNNHMFIVMPNSYAAFYDCTIDDDNLEVKCLDICDNAGLNGGECLQLGYQPCVTSVNNYLIIVGGMKYNTLYTSILIWDMDINEWVTDMNEFGYGELSVGVKASSCSVWNNTLYVLGGKTTSSTALNIIQKCELRKDCVQLSATLNVGRYYSQSKTVGKNIVVVCGETDTGINVYAFVCYTLNL